MTKGEFEKLSIEEQEAILGSPDERDGKCGRCGKTLPANEASDGICFDCAMKEWNRILQ